MITQKDPRGFLKEVLDQPVHINIIEIKAGYARGGHSHEYPEKFFVVAGCGYFSEKDSESRFIQEGDVVQTKSGVPHYIRATIYCALMLVEVRDGGIKFEANEYKPFRDIVKMLMEK